MAAYEKWLSEQEEETLETEEAKSSLKYNLDLGT